MHALQSEAPALDKYSSARHSQLPAELSASHPRCAIRIGGLHPARRTTAKNSPDIIKHNGSDSPVRSLNSAGEVGGKKDVRRIAKHRTFGDRLLGEDIDSGSIPAGGGELNKIAKRHDLGTARQNHAGVVLDPGQLLSIEETRVFGSCSGKEKQKPAFGENFVEAGRPDSERVQDFVGNPGIIGAHYASEWFQKRRQRPSDVSESDQTRLGVVKAVG